MSARPVKRVPGQGRVTPRGATRQPTRSGLSVGTKTRLRRVAWMALVLGALAAAYQWLSEPVLRWLDRPVAEVSVEGSFRYLDRERVEQLLGPELAVEFLKLDLGEIKELLEREPWIERASLRRRWPDRLEVSLIEQQPIARWGDRGFLNRRGDVIEVEPTEALNELPRLQGADQEAAQLMERYQDLAQLLRSRGLTIQTLHQAPNGAWHLELSDGVRIDIGRDRLVEKVQRFGSVYDRQLVERWDDVKRVDLRYQSGVAVSWKTRPEDE